MSVLYAPCNSSEGMDFETKFCNRCKLDQDYRDNDGDSCPYLAAGLAGVEIPEWTYERGEAVCTEFQAIDDANQPFMQSAAVNDLFPKSKHNLSAGQQMRQQVEFTVDTFNKATNNEPSTENSN